MAVGQNIPAASLSVKRENSRPETRYRAGKHDGTRQRHIESHVSCWSLSRFHVEKSLSAHQSRPSSLSLHCTMNDLYPMRSKREDEHGWSCREPVQTNMAIRIGHGLAARGLPRPPLSSILVCG
ncbi:hypothetical protein HRR83_008872 [Exophiala dermatitidis]|uniref:Uncharacterized protein n=1 Tax=Exophiala dermatitidis TaxID=5970 RepID=A0AAN6ELA2_EXODE|nr:hypothetical protein HRR73_008863 [Exophiala dermatitidis]KAJ4504688.1 hypothetical protein HRR74_008954 [Exophiala dermatitidis]KAJ4533568.1 hypothetical protein HRR77_008544 [Exophiala dermatitidis]KAJ4540336.1 hypothetical protein HRR76_003739 [Exophiala dermatitidis]KAJ4559149.1 hypothetical protein HRR79_008390 [Exophiala dermatitidis]